jgi:hypothetical protein
MIMDGFILQLLIAIYLFDTVYSEHPSNKGCIS